MEEKRGRVEVPAEYFLKMAKNDYTNWKRALAREFYQNSIDARASVIEVTADVSRRRIKRAMSEAVAQVGTALTDAEAFVVEQSLRAFLASGTKRSTNAVQQFITETIASLQRADLERRAASQQFAEDQLDAIAQQRRDNRRRAIILIILLMLS